MKKMLYIAGPYTKPDPIVNVRRAVSLGQKFRDNYGVITIVPHLNMLEHFLFPREYFYWLDSCLDLLSRCDAVFRIEGESFGADLEVKTAKRLNIPVFYLEEEVKAWAESPTIVDAPDRHKDNHEQCP